MKEKQALRYMAEYTKVLGIPARDILASAHSRMKLFWEDEPRLSRRWLGTAGVVVKIRVGKRQAIDFKETVAHEVVHLAFSGLRHGVNFERYVKALQRGHLFFAGRMTDLGKVNVLDITVPKPKVTMEDKFEDTQRHIKSLRTKIKRLMTLVRKWEQKERRLKANSI